MAKKVSLDEREAEDAALRVASRGKRGTAGPIVSGDDTPSASGDERQAPDQGATPTGEERGPGAVGDGEVPGRGSTRKPARGAQSRGDKGPTTVYLPRDVRALIVHESLRRRLRGANRSEAGISNIVADAVRRSFAVPTCPKCKTTLDEGARFCSQCGERTGPDRD